MWKEHQIKLPKCECCGRILEEGEVAWHQFCAGNVARPREKGNPHQKVSKGRLRCGACYEKIWH